MSYDDDRALHEAIGHMSMLASPSALGKASRQVRDADPAVAAHLLRWADLHACPLTTLDFEDRRRHWPSLFACSFDDFAEEARA